MKNTPTAPPKKSPLQSYAAYNAKGMQKSLAGEQKRRLGDLKTAFGAQRAQLGAQQRQGNEQLGTELSRFAAVNRLDPGSGALLKFRTDAQEKQGQDYATQNAALAGEEARARESLASEVGQRGFQGQQLAEQSRQFGAQQNLAMEESQFNRAMAQFGFILQAREMGIKTPEDWAKALEGNIFGNGGFGKSAVPLPKTPTYNAPKPTYNPLTDYKPL